MSDKLGRKKANQLSVTLVFFSSWILIWPKGLWVFMACRFVTGIGSGKSSSNLVYELSVRRPVYSLSSALSSSQSIKLYFINLNPVALHP